MDGRMDERTDGRTSVDLYLEIKSCHKASLGTFIASPARMLAGMRIIVLMSPSLEIVCGASVGDGVLGRGWASSTVGNGSRLGGCGGGLFSPSPFPKNEHLRSSFPVHIPGRDADLICGLQEPFPY